jgi:hypothetical protein
VKFDFWDAPTDVLDSSHFWRRFRGSGHSHSVVASACENAPTSEVQFASLASARIRQKSKSGCASSLGDSAGSACTMCDWARSIGSGSEIKSFRQLNSVTEFKSGEIRDCIRSYPDSINLPRLHNCGDTAARADRGPPRCRQIFGAVKNAMGIACGARP